MSTFGQIFLVIFMLGAAWLVLSGVITFFTKQCTIWVGGRSFALAGRKAILGGMSQIAVGLLLLAVALWQIRESGLFGALGK